MEENGWTSSYTDTKTVQIIEKYKNDNTLPQIPRLPVYRLPTTLGVDPLPEPPTESELTPKSLLFYRHDELKCTVKLFEEKDSPYLAELSIHLFQVSHLCQTSLTKPSLIVFFPEERISIQF